MIIGCKSCEKNFVVPDAAITVNGRLVQCSSCGLKWTQYPLKLEIKNTSIKTEKKDTSILVKSLNKKKKKKTLLYSSEYLKKKHGIKIINPSRDSLNPNIKKSTKKIKYGFYPSLFTILIFVITFIGTLNLTKEIIIFNFPFLEQYILYLFETLSNIEIILSDFISAY